MHLNEKSYLNKKGKQITLISIFIVFGLIYSSISLVNHYLFRTYALDLGMFNHAIFDFSHLRLNYITLNVIPQEVNYFGDHFSPLTALVSPLQFIFGTYTLLILQISSILFGGYGIFKYASENSDYKLLPYLILIQFFGIWTIYASLSFDYHSNVVGAMLVPWFIYFLEKKNKPFAFLFFLLILFAKENMALWMFFIILGLAIKNNFHLLRKETVFISILMLGALIYFIVVVTYLMPALNKGIGNDHLARYPALGKTLPQMISTIFKRPFYTFSLLFNSTLDGEIYTNIKSEMHLMVFVSGGICLLFAPHYLVMLLPIYAQKLFSNDYGLWGINAHYCIEFAPVLSLALFETTKRFTKPGYAYTTACIFILTTFYLNYKKTEKRDSIWYNPLNTKFYFKEHYQTNLNVNEIYSALKIIPDDAVISVHSAISPHLALRERIYHFPIIKDAEYIATFTNEKQGFYPLSAQEFHKVIEDLQLSGIQNNL